MGAVVVVCRDLVEESSLLRLAGIVVESAYKMELICTALGSSCNTAAIAAVNCLVTLVSFIRSSGEMLRM